MHLFRKNSEFAVSLNRIHMKKDSRIHPLDQSSRFFNGLKRSYFIVCMHNGNQNGFPCDGSLQIFRPDTSFLVYRKISDPKPFLLQLLHSLQNSRMLNLCCNQMSSCSAIGIGTAAKCQIIRFCSSRSKKDFLLINLEIFSNSFFGITDILLRLHTLSMQTGGISVILTHYLCLQLCHFIKTSCCSRII